MRLSSEQVATIRRMASAGYRNVDIAAEVGVTSTTVGTYARGFRRDNPPRFARATPVGRRLTRHCKRGHEFTLENTYTYTAKSGYIQRHCRACAKIRRGRRGFPVRTCDRYLTVLNTLLADFTVLPT